MYFGVKNKSYGGGYFIYIYIKKNPTCLIRIDTDECYFEKKKKLIEIRLQVSSHEAWIGS